MTDGHVEDNISIQSDESSETNISLLKEKLHSLINQESKHTHNYYDLHTKDNFTRLDLENLNNSCQRYDDQKKKKSELLEEYYDKLSQYQKRNQTCLREKLTSVMQKLEETNTLFCEAFNDYNSDVLRNTVSYLDSETEKLEKKLIDVTKCLSNLEQKGKITQSLMKPKSNQVSAIEQTINALFESSMKRPEIELEETVTRLTNEIQKLENKREDMKATLMRCSQ